VVIDDADIIWVDGAGLELRRFETDGNLQDVRSTSDGGLVITGYRRQPNTSSHMWVLKINAAGEFTPPVVD